MKRTVTKYPSSQVEAAARITEENSKLLGYAINYRNMHTAIHGLLWSPDEDLIDSVLKLCQAMEDAESESEYNDYMNELEGYQASNELFIDEEIDYRDITKDDKYYYEDGYVEIVNPVWVDLYM